MEIKLAKAFLNQGNMYFFLGGGGHVQTKEEEEKALAVKTKGTGGERKILLTTQMQIGCQPSGRKNVLPL